MEFVEVSKEIVENENIKDFLLDVIEAKKRYILSKYSTVQKKDEAKSFLDR